MKKIQFNKYGKITSGKDSGCYIIIEKENYNDESCIVVIDDIDSMDPFRYGYDNFLQDNESLIELFEENNWEIYWLDKNSLAELDNKINTLSKLLDVELNKYNIRDITASIAQAKDLLYNTKFYPSIIEELNKVLLNIDIINIKGTKNVVEKCIKKVLTQVAHGEYRSAGIILHFIYNLPYKKSDFRFWSSRKFVSNNVLFFVENFGDVISGVDVLSWVCNELKSIDREAEVVNFRTNF